MQAKLLFVFPAIFFFSSFQSFSQVQSHYPPKREDDPPRFLPPWHPQRQDSQRSAGGSSQHNDRQRPDAIWDSVCRGWPADGGARVDVEGGGKCTGALHVVGAGDSWACSWHGFWFHDRKVERKFDHRVLEESDNGEREGAGDCGRERKVSDGSWVCSS